MTEPQTIALAADVKELRRSFGQFATGVAVVTTTFEGRPAGVTVNSFSSASLDPPLVTWAIGRSSRSFEAFSKAPHFNVHVLSADQIALSGHFASSVDDKFTGIEWSMASNAAPLLPGACAHFLCAVHDRVDVGDHLMLMGRVLAFEHSDRAPLVFARGRYAVVAEHPAVADAPGG